ncbi:MAG: hypothetical protein ACFBZ9_08220 [Sphingomonadales bacterium]
MSHTSSLLTRAAISIMAIQLSASAQAQDAPSNTEEIFVSALRTQTPASSIPAMITLVERQDVLDQLTIAQDIQSLLGNLAPGFAPSRQKLSGFGESFRGRSPL